MMCSFSIPITTRKTRNYIYTYHAGGGGGWVAGVGEFHVDDVPLRERRRGAGVTARER